MKIPSVVSEQRNRQTYEANKRVLQAFCVKESENKKKTVKSIYIQDSDKNRHFKLRKLASMCMESYFD